MRLLLLDTQLEWAVLHSEGWFGTDFLWGNLTPLLLVDSEGLTVVPFSSWKKKFFSMDPQHLYLEDCSPYISPGFGLCKGRVPDTCALQLPRRHAVGKPGPMSPMLLEVAWRGHRSPTLWPREVGSCSRGQSSGLDPDFKSIHTRVCSVRFLSPA